MADYTSTLTGVQMDNALIDMAEHNSEAYAVGERNGIPVGQGDVTYQNNARYYAQQAQSIAPASVTEAVRWDIAQTALTDANKEMARANIDAGKNGAWTNPNLLDNPFFTIRQRGNGSFTGQVYGVDRWQGSTGSVTVTPLTNYGIAITTTNAGGLAQYFADELKNGLDGKVVTMSVKLTDGTIKSVTGTYSKSSTNITVALDGNLTAYLQADRVILYASGSHTTATNIEAVKLELGSVSTIANDVPPDYGEELRKCQRRLFIHDFANGEVIANGFAVSANYSVLSLALPVSMASDGTLTGTVTANPLIYGGGTGEQVSSLSVSAVKGNYAKIGVATTVMPSNNSVTLYANTNIRLTISKEL